MGSVRALPPDRGVDNRPAEWDAERGQLLGRRISDLGLEIAGTRVERLVIRLYDELAARTPRRLRMADGVIVEQE